METEINGRKYKVKVLPLDMAPYTSLYAELTKRKPKDLAEAEDIREQLKGVISKVLAEVVTPAPQNEDQILLFSFATAQTARVIDEQTKLFRESSAIASEKSSVPGDKTEDAPH
jgi:hypothetical protein